VDLKNKKIILSISLVGFIGVAFIVGHSLFGDFAELPESGHGICPKMIPNYLLWISLILTVIMVVPLSYYIISKRLEEKMEKNLNAIARMVEYRIKSGSEKDCLKSDNGSSILKLLNPGEKKVVERIIENGGKVLQSEVGRMEGMTKLRAHRAVKGLEARGVISLEPYGKTNRIVLKKDIEDIVF
jgi:uncharacterized membrane protein